MKEAHLRHSLSTVASNFSVLYQDKYEVSRTNLVCPLEHGGVTEGCWKLGVQAPRELRDWEACAKKLRERQKTVCEGLCML